MATQRERDRASQISDCRGDGTLRLNVRRKSAPDQPRAKRQKTMEAIGQQERLPTGEVCMFGLIVSVLTCHFAVNLGDKPSSDVRSLQVDLSVPAELVQGQPDIRPGYE
jgi:hypothetical protein